MRDSRVRYRVNIELHRYHQLTNVHPARSGVRGLDVFAAAMLFAGGGGGGKCGGVCG